MNQDNQATCGPKYVNPTKKYGLTIPAKSGESALKKPMAIKKPVVKPCIFDEDDDAVEEEVDVKKKLFASANRIKKETQIEIEKALKEDPSVFEYDNVYDELEKEKAKLDPKLKNKNESKEPKYIAGIMKMAAKRQMEFEKLQDRKIQKERETEGDLWGDKEVFVTSAYRKRMEERQQMEEEERRQEQIEQLLDVRKQKDLSGFYSSLLKMKTGEMVVEEESEKLKREIKEKEKSSTQKNYRAKRDESSSEDEEDQKPDVNENLESNPENADKNEEPDAKKPKIESNSDEAELMPPPAVPATDNASIKEEKVDSEAESKPRLNPEEQRRLRRIALFTKRTVNEKFDQEISEYFVRKSQILSTKSYIERE